MIESESWKEYEAYLDRCAKAGVDKMSFRPAYPWMTHNEELIGKKGGATEAGNAERKEMLSEEDGKRVKRQQATGEALRMIPGARAFLVIAVMHNGDMAASIVCPGYADAIALAQEGGNLMAGHLASFKPKASEEM